MNTQITAKPAAGAAAGGPSGPNLAPIENMIKESSKLLEEIKRIAGVSDVTAAVYKLALAGGVHIMPDIRLIAVQIEYYNNKIEITAVFENSLKVKIDVDDGVYAKIL